MEKKTKITITILSVISIAGITWFIYDKIKISRLNAKLSTPEEMQQTIDKKSTGSVYFSISLQKNISTAFGLFCSVFGCVYIVNFIIILLLVNIHFLFV